MTVLREATEHDATYERAVRESYPSLTELMRERYGPPLDYLGRTPAERERDRRRETRTHRPGWSL